MGFIPFSPLAQRTGHRRLKDRRLTSDRTPRKRGNGMELGLEDKVAIVTGGGAIGGIGWAAVKELLAEGARVVMGDLFVEPGYAEVTEGGRAETVEIDLAVAGNPERLVTLTVSRFGRLDILVNNLGVTPIREGFLSITDEDWFRTLNVNFMSNVRASRAALPHLIESKGVIVNIASTLGKSPMPSMVDYSAFKAATLNLTKTISEEFGPKGVRVVAVSPGPVLTPQWSRPGGQIDTMANAFHVDRETMLTKKIPEVLGLITGRMVESREVAAAIVFAASSRAASLTGSQILVDAGSHKAT
jgi:NAD(P)-dependent dehydrogenase (short-subunit alcohol dehydrogenase family)